MFSTQGGPAFGGQAQSAVLNVEQEVADITILHDVVFSFYTQFTCLSNFFLTLVCFQIIQGINLQPE